MTELVPVERCVEAVGSGERVLFSPGGAEGTTGSVLIHPATPKGVGVRCCGEVRVGVTPIKGQSHTMGDEDEVVDGSCSAPSGNTGLGVSCPSGKWGFEPV